jgi:mRNA-degrading endonuclease RelE of RelBE toxin-antitoxin system
MNSSLEINSPKSQKNHIVLLDKAQIAVDFLPTKDKEQFINTINYLEDFPVCTKAQIYKLNPLNPNHFVARNESDYRVIFKFQNREITIVDIVSRNRLKFIFGKLKNHKS